MFDLESLHELPDDEIVRLYELFFGQVLVRKSIDTYVNGLKSVMQTPSFFEKLMEKLNPLEKNLLFQISDTANIPTFFANEKLSLVMGEHPSIIGKAINTLCGKNYLLHKEDSFVVPNFLLTKPTDSLNLKTADLKEKEYNSETIVHMNNIFLYLLSSQFVYSKTSTLYKKDFTQLLAFFGSVFSYDDAFYNIVSYCSCKMFTLNDKINWDAVKKYFSLSSHEQAYMILQTIAPFIMPLFDQALEKGKAVVVEKSQLSNVYNRLLLTSVLKEEPFRLSQQELMGFLKIVHMINEENHHFEFLAYQKSPEKKMDITISSNFSIFVNSDTTDPSYYLTAIFGNFVKFDKLAEFEISPTSIQKTINECLEEKDFDVFLKLHNQELQPNVLQTIHDWFEKFGSYYTAEGIFFIADNEKKGKMIQKLIDEGLVEASTIKKDSIFLIEEEKKEQFFDFIKSSQIFYYENKFLFSQNHVRVKKTPLH